MRGGRPEAPVFWGITHPLGGAFVNFPIREHGLARFLRLYNEGEPGSFDPACRDIFGSELAALAEASGRMPGGRSKGLTPANITRYGIMKRLLVFRVGNRWFAQATEMTRSGSGSLKETRWVEVPQTETEIEGFARREGYTIEWDSPSKPEDGPA